MKAGSVVTAPILQRDITGRRVNQGIKITGRDPVNQAGQRRSFRVERGNDIQG
ncbi:MAG: hypothetical protein KJ077_02760 [Anaerolineae bacterium]|nr:hypothetical protein [Anaerolineae bacterium]